MGTFKALILAIAIVAGLAVVRGLAGNLPYGTAVFVGVCILALKPIVGFRTWWHALAGAAVGAFLAVVVEGPGVSGREGLLAMILVPTGLLLVAFVAVIKLIQLSRENGRRVVRQ